MELKTVWTGGHTQTVLCLGVNADGQVASGGENGEVCLWSPDGKLTSKINFPSKADVNSVCFSPGQASVLYLSVGEVIEMVDIRCSDASMATFTYNKDDINQLAIDPKDVFLAACDDDGIIKIIDVRNRKVFRTLKGHDNICSSVSFHPTAPREIASGGLDCFLHTWEITRGRPLASVNMQEQALAGEDSHAPSPYMINPPFVHSLDYSGNGNLLACGLENARIQLLERKGKKNLLPKTSLEGHTLGVTQVCFVPECPGQSQDLLLSAGNDCRLNLWDTTSTSARTEDASKVNNGTIPENSAKNLTEVQLASKRITTSSTGDCDQGNVEIHRDGCTTTSSTDEGASASNLNKKQPRLCVKHKDKFNWITPVRSSGGINMVLVADVSEIISVYHWQYTRQ